MGSLSAALPPLPYPAARRNESVVDVLHGVAVADPYRWFESPEISSHLFLFFFLMGCVLNFRLEDPDAEEVKGFVEAQVAITDSVLAVCEDRDRLRQQITTLFDHPRYDTPFKRGGKYFYYHNTGLQAQSVLYVQVLRFPLFKKKKKKLERLDFGGFFLVDFDRFECCRMIWMVRRRFCWIRMGLVRMGLWRSQREPSARMASILGMDLALAGVIG